MILLTKMYSKIFSQNIVVKKNKWSTFLSIAKLHKLVKIASFINNLCGGWKEKNIGFWINFDCTQWHTRSTRHNYFYLLGSIQTALEDYISPQFINHGCFELNIFSHSFYTPKTSSRLEHFLVRISSKTKREEKKPVFNFLDLLFLVSLVVSIKWSDVSLCIQEEICWECPS